MSAGLWDAKFLRDGQTGYGDPLTYRYDQPLRMRLVRRAVRRLFPEGLVGRRALDIGCGTGDFVQVLLEEGVEEVHGVDISPRVVEATRRRFAEAGARVTIEVRPIEELTKAGRFDLITSVTVLQHLLEDAVAVRALRHLRAALTKEGRIVALEIAPTRPVRPSEPGLVRERTLAEWDDLLTQSGLAHAERPAVYSPLGFCLAQQLAPRVLRLVAGGRGPRAGDGGPGSRNAGERAPISPLRSVYRLVRGLLLAACYPIDRAIEVKVPARFAYYHLLVLRA